MRAWLNRAERLAGRVRERIGPLAFGTLIIFFLQRGGDAANLVYKAILGKTLAAINFGAVDPVFAVTAIMSLPVMIVLHVAVKSISRLRAAGKEDECRGLLRDLARLGLVGSLVTVGVTLLIGDFVLERLHLESRAFLVLIAALLVLTWWQPMFQAVLRGGLRYRIMIFTSPLGALSMLACVILFVGVLKLGLQGALLARIASGALSIGILLAFLRGTFAGPRARYAEEFRLMRAMLLPMTLYWTSITVLFQFDRLFVRNFLLSESGGFGAIVTVGSIPTYLLSAIVYVIFPLAAAEHAEGRAVRRYANQAVLWGCAITIGFAVFCALFGRPLLGLWNDAFVPYAWGLWPYALAMGLHGIIQIVGSVELARHRYGFLWFFVLPTAAMCGGLYLFRAGAALTHVIWAGIAARLVVLAGTWVYTLAAERGRERSR